MNFRHLEIFEVIKKEVRTKNFIKKIEIKGSLNGNPVMCFKIDIPIRGYKRILKWIEMEINFIKRAGVYLPDKEVKKFIKQLKKLEKLAKKASWQYKNKTANFDTTLKAVSKLIEEAE